MLRRLDSTARWVNEMAKIVCGLFDDPIGGYPPVYARDGLPKIDRYPGGQTVPTPKAIDFQPGQLLGSVSGELGLRKYLESNGHQLVVTSDKDGPNSRFERELADADIVISQPFWPAYLTAERIAKAPKLKLAVTAGIGSDHVDLQAAIDHGITVAEVTYSNSISVSEHAVMMILGLVRNYIPSYQWVVKGGWNIADCVARSYDVEGMHVGTVAAGRIGTAILRRLKPFDVHLHYFDRQRLPEAIEKELNVVFHPTVEDMVKVCDVVTINAPLHPQTENLFDDAMLSKMKRGAYIVNTARAKICNRDAIVRALEGGQLAGYAGDVWFPQPPPNDHPWRTMPNHGMTPHISGSSLSAEARYAAGTREILECWFEGRPIRNEYLIVDGGKLAGAGAHSYSAGNATSGSEEASRFKTKT
jgi:formate dehydrogenase